MFLCSIITRSLIHPNFLPFILFLPSFMLSWHYVSWSSQVLCLSGAGQILAPSGETFGFHYVKGKRAQRLKAMTKKGKRLIHLDESLSSIRSHNFNFLDRPLYREALVKIWRIVGGVIISGCGRCVVCYSDCWLCYVSMETLILPCWSRDCSAVS